MKEIESIIIFPQFLLAKPMRIAMEMVTAMPVSANAPLIMSMPKIVQFLDVSSFHKGLLVGSECMLYRSTSRVPWYFLSNWQEFRQIDKNFVKLTSVHRVRKFPLGPDKINTIWRQFWIKKWKKSSNEDQ